MNTCGIVLLLMGVVTALPTNSRQLCNPQDPHDIIYGCDPPPKPEDLFYQATIRVHGSFLQVQTRTYEICPEENDDFIITCIRVTNFDEGEDGGCPFIAHGGPGFHNVTLLFISQKSKGLHFTVEIYGHEVAVPETSSSGISTTSAPSPTVTIY